MAKKSLYEILELPRSASYADVQAAYQRLLQTLEAQQATLDHSDYNLKLRVLKVAYSTLSAPSSRDAYDASLAAAPNPAATQELSLQPMNTTDAALRAEVMALRAETMALRVDALGLKADVVSRSAGYRSSAMDTAGMASDIMRPASNMLRSVLFAMGVVVAIAIAVKLFFMFFASGTAADAQVQQRLMQEKVYLQEYAQTHGVRPATMAEAAQLDAERQRKQALETQARQTVDQQRAAEEKERKFEEDARKRSAQVSAELELAEERARRTRENAEEKEENAKNRAQETEQRRIETERARKEAEQEKWRRIIVSPSRN